MTELRESMIDADDVQLHVQEAGEGPPVLLLHGFPELGYSWRHQLPALAAAGYRAIAPDQRGYGRSSVPSAIEEYDLDHLCRDQLALLDALGIGDEAVVVGHDWGAGVAWGLAQRYPERFRGVVGMSGPFLPRLPSKPTEFYAQAYAGKWFYVLYFQEPGPADAEMNRDPATTMRRILGATNDADGSGLHEMTVDDGRGFLDRLNVVDELPSWITEEELAHYAESFARTGFTGGLNWYRNADRNWEQSADLAGVGIVIPSLFVIGSLDSVRVMFSPDQMSAWVQDHRGDVYIDGAGHWVQQERPTEVNAALIAFLDELASEERGVS